MRQARDELQKRSPDEHLRELAILSQREDRRNMKDAAKRKFEAAARATEVLGYDVRVPSRGARTLKSGQRLFFAYARGHQRSIEITYWFGIPNDARPEDLLILLLGDADFVLPVAVLADQAEWMTRSIDGRLTPYVVAVDGHFEQRIPDRDVVVSLDQFRDAYGNLT